jgi:hypothetical protein
MCCKLLSTCCLFALRRPYRGERFKHRASAHCLKWSSSEANALKTHTSLDWHVDLTDTGTWVRLHLEKHTEQLWDWVSGVSVQEQPSLWSVCRRRERQWHCGSAAGTGMLRATTCTPIKCGSICDLRRTDGATFWHLHKWPALHRTISPVPFYSKPSWSTPHNEVYIVLKFWLVIQLHVK